MVNDLLRQEPDEGAQDYLDVLTDLVAAYEDEHVPMPDVSEADVPARTDAVQRAQPDGAGEGRRDRSVQHLGRPDRRSFLTKGQILKLSKFFHLAPAAFLPRRPWLRHPDYRENRELCWVAWSKCRSKSAVSTCRRRFCSPNDSPTIAPTRWHCGDMI